jgi:hypothetical protein
VDIAFSPSHLGGSDVRLECAQLIVGFTAG